ncbi:ABC transporter permease subunit [Sediminibacillus dalangtanensis]|uniref:ABC transporter permease subunit n=1 Tax=Sediminibacillus dalangtanensis TaxID=2729421 RepID=A0ABX7VQX5_9BACI|nr:ABC transporter permease subunit [Sediminibacillus dalangtanensis]QTM98918.1 ABC transporter permease subunit [Sediminibacillus dalangtanensis]
MLTLTRNEWFKLSKKPSIYLMGVIIVLLVIATGMIGKITEDAHSVPDNWQENLAAKNEQMKEQNQEHANNPILTENNRNQIAVNNYRIDHDIKPGAELSVWSYTVENVPLISVAGLLVMIIAAGIVSSEFSGGTIKLVMIRPAPRWKVLLAKYLTVLAYGLLLVVLLFIASLAVGVILFGMGESMVHLTVNNGVVSEENVLVYLLRYFFFSTIDLWMMVSLAFALSAIFRNTAVSLGVSLFAYLMGGTFTSLLAERFDWTKYLLFANTDLNRYVSGTPFVEGMTMTFSIVMLFLYLAVFLGTAFMTFTKRDIS